MRQHGLLVFMPLTLFKTFLWGCRVRVCTSHCIDNSKLFNLPSFFYSEEKQSKKKSKSSDRTHSPPPIKDSSSLLPPAKKVCHRSSSVSSDRSDNSVKSRSSSDKQQAAGSRYNTHGELAKSKSAAKASTSNHSTHAAPSGSR